MGSPDVPPDDVTSPLAPAARPSLEAGALVARRYRIVRFLGAGGMGEVYEAQDVDLGGPVALKTIRPGTSAPALLQRFKREIQLARQVTHPHVARTFDVGYHDLGPGRPPLTFLTMELLPGETLAERLRRGPIPAAEVRPLAHAMASGLAAAHAAGVVHRDFKPGNVMLVPGSSSPRVVVTDFGLAQALSHEAEATESGIVGSPAYMAPEQVTQGAVSPATDVYSFGVVLYEVITGSRPFGEPGDLPLVQAIKRVGRRPASPRTLEHGVDPVLEELVMSCLEPDPARRPPSAAHLLEALEGRASLPRRPRRRAPYAIAALLAVLAAGATVHLLRRAASTEATPTTSRAGVVLLGFRNLSGRPEAAWLSTALVEMLTSELSAGQGLRLVPAETVARVKMELALPDAPTLAEGSLAGLRANLGADLVVSGSYLALAPGGPVRLDLRVQHVATGETLPAVVETGTEAELPALVARAGAALRAQLGTPEPDARRGSALPRGAEAARLYVEGLDALRRYDALVARDRLERAVAAEPEHPLPHIALSEAFTMLGYDDRAAAEARLGLERGALLSDEQRLLAEGRAAETGREWEKAAEAYRLLWRSRPDTLEYGLYVAHALTSGARARDALEVVAELRRLPAPAQDDPRVDLAEAAAAAALWDLPRLKEKSAAAAQKGRDRQAKLLVGRALVQQLHAASNMGEWALIDPLYREARAIHEAAGHRPGLALTLHQMAVALDLKGDRAGARTLFLEALAIRRQIGDRGGTARTVNGLGWLEHQEGRPEEARRHLEEAVAIAREVNDRGFVSVALNNLSLAQRSLGRHAESRQSLEEAVVLARQTGQKVPLARSLNNLAWVMLSEGDLAGAALRYEEAIASARAAEARYPLGYGLEGLADVRRAQGRSSDAEGLLRDALAVREGSAAEGHTKLQLSTVLLDQGRVAEAAHLVEEVARTWPVEGDSHDGAHTAIHLSEVRLAQGRLDEAERLLSLTRKAEAALARGTGRFELLMARVGVDTARRRLDPERRRELLGAMADAREGRTPWLPLELELVLGKAELAAGRESEGRARLEALEQRARKIGFGLVAEGARRALGPGSRGPA
jgi:tetratricopeptide (TPR) repeat protein/TolB-like protein